MPSIPQHKPIKHGKFRAFLQEYGYTYEDAGKVIGHDEQYIGQRLSGRRKWTWDDIQTLCKWMDVAIEDAPKYFPREGGAS